MKKGFKIAILRFLPRGAVLRPANRQKCVCLFVFLQYLCINASNEGVPLKSEDRPVFALLLHLP